MKVRCCDCDHDNLMFGADPRAKIPICASPLFVKPVDRTTWIDCGSYVPKGFCYDCDGKGNRLVGPGHIEVCEKCEGTGNKVTGILVNVSLQTPEEAAENIISSLERSWWGRNFDWGYNEMYREAWGPGGRGAP